MRLSLVWPMVAAFVLALSFDIAVADGSGDPAAASEDDGKYFDAEGNPTFKITGNSVDWYTYSGFRRYHSECHVCHGPAGGGSSFGPALSESLKAIDYATFVDVVVNGRQNVSTARENVMPAFGTNPNVMCYLDDIFVYLRARANGAVGPTRPAEHADKPASFAEAEDACMGRT